MNSFQKFDGKLVGFKVNFKNNVFSSDFLLFFGINFETNQFDLKAHLYIFSSNLSLIIAGAFGKGPNDERKVPPRTPDQRLATLNRYMKEWIAGNIAPKRDGRADNMTDNLENQVMAKLESAFVNRKCASWSPTWLPHGGPNPDGIMGNVQWKDYIKTLNDKLQDLVDSNQSKKRSRRDLSNVRSRREIEELQDSDVFDNYFIEAQEDGERSASVALQRALSSDGAVALKQLLVGYLKWSFRYLSECPNEAFDKHNLRVYDTVEHVLLSVYEMLHGG
jgi:hypothetical protein